MALGINKYSRCSVNWNDYPGMYNHSLAYSENEIKELISNPEYEMFFGYVFEDFKNHIKSIPIDFDDYNRYFQCAVNQHRDTMGLNITYTSISLDIIFITVEFEYKRFKIKYDTRLPLSILNDIKLICDRDRRIDSILKDIK